MSFGDRFPVHHSLSTSDLSSRRARSCGFPSWDSARFFSAGRRSRLRQDRGLRVRRQRRLVRHRTGRLHRRAWKSGGWPLRCGSTPFPGLLVSDSLVSDLITSFGTSFRSSAVAVAALVMHMRATIWTVSSGPCRLDGESPQRQPIDLVRTALASFADCDNPPGENLY